MQECFIPSLVHIHPAVHEQKLLHKVVHDWQIKDFACDTFLCVKLIHHILVCKVSYRLVPDSRNNYKPVENKIYHLKSHDWIRRCKISMTAVVVKFRIFIILSLLLID